MLDRFRGRIMFPIHNHTGKVVGFTGRILPQLDQGRYRKICEQSRNADFPEIKIALRILEKQGCYPRDKTAVLVEGQMDFLMSWQSGVKNIVASSGTALDR